jgi:hypothetical protein
MADATTLKADFALVDDQQLRRAKVRRMHVSDSGMHCFLLSDHELFYNHYASDSVQKIKVEGDSSSEVG